MMLLILSPCFLYWGTGPVRAVKLSNILYVLRLTHFNFLFLHKLYLWKQTLYISAKLFAVLVAALYVLKNRKSCFRFHEHLNNLRIIKIHVHILEIRILDIWVS